MGAVVLFRLSSLQTLQIVVVIGMLTGCMGYAPVRQDYWDGKVKEMCDNEGGIRVFQVVLLEPQAYRQLLNNQNQIDIPSEKFASPDAAYVYTFNSEYLVDGSLRVRKDVQKVLKMPERILLSEQVSFSRVGGDFPTGIGHATSYTCSRPAESLFARTFRQSQPPGS